jgi:hypothetical protein
VAVEAKLKGLSIPINGRIFKDLRLVSNILVYDNAYEVVITSSMKDASAGGWLGSSNYLDTGSFVVSLETGKAKIIEKVNRNSDDKLSYAGNCIIKVMNKGSNYGNIHVGPVRSIKVTPASATQPNAIIEIAFVTRPVSFSILDITCPDPQTGTLVKTTSSRGNMMLAMMQTLPAIIKFEAKPGVQTLPGSFNSPELTYTITVKRLETEF